MSKRPADDCLSLEDEGASGGSTSADLGPAVGGNEATVAVTAVNEMISRSPIIDLPLDKPAASDSGPPTSMAVVTIPPERKLHYPAAPPPKKKRVIAIVKSPAKALPAEPKPSSSTHVEKPPRSLEQLSPPSAVLPASSTARLDDKNKLTSRSPADLGLSSIHAEMVTPSTLTNKTTAPLSTATAPMVGVKVEPDVRPDVKPEPVDVALPFEPFKGVNKLVESASEAEDHETDSDAVKVDDKTPKRRARKPKVQTSSESLLHSLTKLHNVPDLPQQPYPAAPHCTPGHLSAAAYDPRLVEVFGKFINLVQVEVNMNGGALVLHLYPDLEDVVTSGEDWERLGELFLAETFREVDGNCLYSMGIVHNGAATLPNILRHVQKTYPNVEVMQEMISQSKLAISTSIDKYVKEVDETLKHGTHTAGGLRPISLVGVMQEERGGYFKDVIEMLELCAFARAALPWGPLSKLKGMQPSASDDGPILWSRPGEQMISATDFQNLERRASVLLEASQGTDSAGASKTKPRKRELDALMAARPRSDRIREKFIADRTGCHADHAGLPPDRVTIAAVGILQPVNDNPLDCRISKDVVCFHACDFERLQGILGLDYNEEPIDQCIDRDMWVEEAKLNQLSRAGIRWARIQLRLNDVYYIPRRVVHQFKTVAACTSVTWHLKYSGYA